MAEVVSKLFWMLKPRNWVQGRRTSRMLVTTVDQILQWRRLIYVNTLSATAPPYISSEKKMRRKPYDAFPSEYFVIQDMPQR